MTNDALCQLTHDMIREKVMYSTRFSQIIGDSLRNDLSDHQAAIIALCIVHADNAHLGQYIREIFTRRVMKMVEHEIALYQPSITDCEKFED